MKKKTHIQIKIKKTVETHTTTYETAKNAKTITPNMQARRTQQNKCGKREPKKKKEKKPKQK